MARPADGRRRRSPVRVVAIGGMASVVCLLPVFLTGTLAPIIQEDLQMTAVGLGVAVALYRAAGAASSPFLGRSADRFGATRSVRIATGAAALSSLGIALTARSIAGLIGCLLVAGCSIALAQPAANRLIAGGVSPAELGTAFGFKQSAPPVASTLAGISVPLVAVTFGWRWSFVGAAALAALMTVLVRPVRRAPRVLTTEILPSRADRSTVLIFATAFGLGTACSSAITTFFVLSVVETGTNEVAAGTMLAIAGLCAVITRVIAGLIADRTPRNHLRGCAALVVTGGIAVALLPVASSVLGQGLAVSVALMGTWGFNGVFWFALIKAFPDSPGTITGSIAPGALIGSTLGPITFGFVAEAIGYTAAFQMTSLLALATGVGLLVSNERIARLATRGD